MRFGQEHIGALVQGRYSLVAQGSGRVFGPSYQAHDHEEGSEVFVKLFVRWPDENALREALAGWLDWGHFSDDESEGAWGPRPAVAGTDPRGNFLVCPWLYGWPLGDGWAESVEPTLPDVIALLLKIAEGLQKLHAQGLVHGALRPSQVFLTEQGAITLLRPGLELFIARSLRSDPDRWALTQAARSNVWSPEVAGYVDDSGPFPTRSADVFGFGRVLEGALDLLPRDLGTPRERLRALADQCLQPRATDRPDLVEVIRSVDSSVQRHRRPPASAPPRLSSHDRSNWSRMRAPSGAMSKSTVAPKPAVAVNRRSRRPTIDLPVVPLAPDSLHPGLDDERNEAPPAKRIIETIEVDAIDQPDADGFDFEAEPAEDSADRTIMIDPEEQQRLAKLPVADSEPIPPHAIGPPNADQPIAPGASAKPSEPPTPWDDPDPWAPKAEERESGEADSESEPEPVTAERLERDVAEAESFARYGLTDRAVERARSILEVAPDHAPAKDLLRRLLPAPAYKDEPLDEVAGENDQTVLAPIDELDEPLAPELIFPGHNDADETIGFEPVDKSAPLDENVQFTVYRPPHLIAEQWADVLFFAHLSDRRPDAPEDSPDPLAEVQRIAAGVLQDAVDDYKIGTADAQAAIPREGTLTVIPSVEGVVFNPPQASFVWSEDVHTCQFRAKSSEAGRTARGTISVYYGPVIVGEVDVALRIEPEGAIAVAQAQVAETGRRYRKIFASYSRRDLDIVRSFEAFARGLGDRYLIDLLDIRSGEVWSERLEEMIRSADVFQLFWSSHAMSSTYVMEEVQYALALSQDIRPVFWERPLPQDPSRNLPPPALSRFHFQFLSAFMPTDGAAAPHLRSPNGPETGQEWLPPPEELQPPPSSTDPFDESATRAMEPIRPAPARPASADWGPEPEPQSTSGAFPAVLPPSHSSYSVGGPLRSSYGSDAMPPPASASATSGLLLVLVAFGLALLIVSTLMLIWFSL